MKPVRTFLQQTAIKALIAAEKPIYDITSGVFAKNRFLSSVDIPFVGTDVKILKETENSVFLAKYNADGTINGGDFKILCTTDLHLDENPDINDLTLSMLVNHIAKEKPDLVIFTGDVILSKYQQIDAVQFGEMMERMGIYWAYIFGNHEAREERGYFKYLILKSLTDFKHCVSKFGKKELYGYGNFVINIMKSETEIRESLFCLDSGRSLREPHITNNNIPRNLSGYDYIKPSQMRFYRDTLRELKREYGGDVKSMLFFHIPLPEYENISHLNGDGTYSFNDGAEVLYGEQHESVGCSPYNSGFFKVIKENGGEAVFCGHDHDNDFAAVYDGVYLVYNQCGGFVTYNSNDPNLKLDKKDWRRGANLITLKSDGTFYLEQRLNKDFL